jgi:hypothetical protein
MLYITLRGHVHATKEDKIYDMKDSFYKKLECVFAKFPKFHTKILLGDFNVKACMEYRLMKPVYYVVHKLLYNEPFLYNL